MEFYWLGGEGADDAPANVEAGTVESVGYVAGVALKKIAAVVRGLQVKKVAATEECNCWPWRRWKVVVLEPLGVKD